MTPPLVVEPALPVEALAQAAFVAPVPAVIVITDLLNGQTWGYAAVHDLVGAGTTLNMSNFPRSVFTIVNNSASVLPINVPGGPPVTVAANGGAAALSTHPNLAPGKSVGNKVGQGGSQQGYRFS